MWRSMNETVTSYYLIESTYFSFMLITCHFEAVPQNYTIVPRMSSTIKTVSLYGLA